MGGSLVDRGGLSRHKHVLLVEHGRFAGINLRTRITCWEHSHLGHAV